MSGHFVETCMGCGAVIRQCRCPGKRTQLWGRCSKCRDLDHSPASIADAVAELPREVAQSYTGRTLTEAEARALGAWNGGRK